MDGRVKNSLRNIKYSFIGQMIGLIISFFSRFIFVKTLTAEYLGLSGLFSNVLSILSLTELGVTTAISFELYKPLAENNTEKIKTLMHFFKKVYIIVGFVMLILGVITIPIYPFFIKELPNIKNLDLIYFMFVFNSALSYFLSYKRILLISDQKRFVETTYKYVCYFLLNLSQIVVLFLTKNYILFLTMQILFTFLENLFISQKINKLYPYLLEKNYTRINNTDKKNIFLNIRSMFVHKVGGIVLNSTDNLVTSKVIGLNIVGLYSNYYLVTSALEKIINQVFTSLIASIGNLNVTSDKSKKTEIFFNIFFINFCIYTFVCSCLLNLFNPFIDLWLGSNYLLGFDVVIIIVVNQYIYGMRRTAMAFREATGNYEKDWYSPLIESMINIIISIILAKKIGLSGVFLGTIISSLCTNFWIEPFVIIKKSLNTKLYKYFLVYFKYLLCTIFILLSSYCLCNLISSNSILYFIIKMSISAFVPIICIYIFFRKDTNLQKITSILRKLIFKKRSNNKN